MIFLMFLLFYQFCALFSEIPITVPYSHNSKILKFSENEKFSLGLTQHSFGSKSWPDMIWNYLSSLFISFNVLLRKCSIFDLDPMGVYVISVYTLPHLSKITQILTPEVHLTPGSLNKPPLACISS